MTTALANIYTGRKGVRYTECAGPWANSYETASNILVSNILVSATDRAAITKIARAVCSRPAVSLLLLFTLLACDL